VKKELAGQILNVNLSVKEGGGKGRFVYHWKHVKIRLEKIGIPRMITADT